MPAETAPNSSEDPDDAENQRVKPKRGLWLKRLALSFGGMVVAVLVAESVLRWMLPADSLITGQEWKFWRENSDLAKDAFVADAELGFHPRLGTSHYDRYGALILGSKAQQIEKNPSRRRVVFLGDSVTVRRSLEHAFKKRFGESAYEYWNCGVGGYNTYQEVKYYKRFCRETKPDHLVVTLHNNDFQATPVAFYDDDGRMAVFDPDRRSTGLNPLLYRYSYIYRVWFSWQVGRQAPHDDVAGARSIRDSFAELLDLLAADEVQLTVLVLPPCKPEVEWQATEVARHEKALEILRGLGIQHFDLLPGLRKAMKQGVNVQESKDDAWHPSPEVGHYFVEDIVLKGFAL